MDLSLGRRWREYLAGGAIAAVVVLAGCGGSSAPAASGSTAGQQVTIMGNSSLRFSPMMVHVHTGAVRITLMDMGSYPHNIVIPALHVRSATVTGDPGSGNATVTVHFPHPGHYAFHCQYHQSAGMVGVFVVS